MRGGPRTLPRRAPYLNSRAMDYKFLTLAVENRIATLSVNRPDKLNALNDVTIGELARAIDEVRGREDIGGLIVTGAGRAFVAGADIGELAGQTPASARALGRKGQVVFRQFEMSPKPVIAAINGFALGGGCELALACHIRIASDKAKFGQPEVKLGTCPGYGGTQRLARLVGKGRAIQLIISGETIDAAEAYRIGLVNRVVDANVLMNAATEMMQQILANAPLAVAYSIEAIDRGLEMSLDDALILEATQFGLLASTDDMKEGTAAFLEKRAPVFHGR